MNLVAEALKTPLRERDSFLQIACQSDPELYREVSEIVTWEERMGDFLSRPLVEFIDLEALEQIFEPGQIVEGRFEILRRVGDGGMGIVYEAFDHTRKQLIAIKCPKPGYDELLPGELEGALQVRHPNVCLVNEIHATRTDLEELRFLTMEFLDGETLAHRLKDGKFEEAAARPIARQLCSGVAEAHRSEVLHRDLKPGNVILCRNKDGSARAVITDFGLATETGNVSDLEGGTPNYMAPELWRGGKASQASDVFSLGVILYEMVTGSRPFPALSKQNVTFPKPVAPSKLVKNLPRRWDAAILPCLRENPDERPSAKEVLAVLDRKPIHQRPAVLGAIAACIALIALAAPNIIDALKPTPFSLVVLPAEASGDLAQHGEGILTDVAKRVQQIQAGKATVSVILPAKASGKGVSTPEQAAKTFGATHALQIKLLPKGDDVTVEGAIIDLHTMAHVRDYSGRFAASDLSDLPTGLTGAVAAALHLHRAAKPESVIADAVAPYNKGREYLEREPHDFADAFLEFQKAAQSDPHSPLPLAGLAEAKAREYQLRRKKEVMQEAQFWLAKAESLDADSPRVRIASGLLHLIQGDNPKALADYQRVEEIEPNNMEALIGSGFAYEIQRMLDKAKNDYHRAISAAPKSYKPYESLGALYFFAGDYGEAAKWYKQAIEQAPDKVNLYGDLAGSYIAQGRSQEAEDEFNRAPKGAATALVLNNFGANLAFERKDAEAIHYYQLAKGQDSNNPIIWLNLGDAQRRLGALADARKSYGTGSELAQAQLNANSTNAAMRAYLAYFQARLGAKDRARSEIAQAMAAPAKDDQVVLCAVQTYEVLGDRAKAISAAGEATPQTLNEINLHPDLAGLQRDSRFKLLLAQFR
jgi:tetratricopeptide (TPR) repeat protein